jgi:hypothetical protein
MRCLGFASRWISLVMACIHLVIYTVLVNGNFVGHIKPSSGICQGYLLSPYLFLICAKALSSLLSQTESKESITRVPNSKYGPKLSHLFFANDSLLFCKANSIEWRRLMHFLGIYEVGFRQMLNLQKTSIFSRNTSHAKRQ